MTGKKFENSDDLLNKTILNRTQKKSTFAVRLEQIQDCSIAVSLK